MAVCIEYDIFGGIYKGNSPYGLETGYTGKPYDSVTGLSDYGFRDYSPAYARFMTEDPIRDGENWFAYVGNNPVNWIDPWGLSAADKQNKEYLAKTIYGEMRGENKATKTAVAWSIRNRADDKNRSIKEVVTAPKQYSAWNPTDKNYEAVTDPKKHSSKNFSDKRAWRESQKVAAEVLNADKSSDPTHGATHYYDKSLDDDPPSWSDTGEEVFVEGVSNIHLFKGVNYSVPKL